MFAFALYDADADSLFLARDRLGVKPLYWAQRGDLVLFGSELKSVLASGLIEPELDYEAIDAYLTLGFLPGPAMSAKRAGARTRPRMRLALPTRMPRSELGHRRP